MGIKLVDYGLLGRLHVVGRRRQVKQTVTGRRMPLISSLGIGARKLKQFRGMLLMSSCRLLPTVTIMTMSSQTLRHTAFLQRLRMARISVAITVTTELATL